MQWVKLSGKIHGCIVDIDFSNHIYLNPYDGTLVSYNARSMYDKKVYKNIRCLLSDQRPEMLLSYDNLIEQNNPESTLLLQDKEVKNELCPRQKDAINTKFIKVYKHDMYTLSNKLKPLQNIYDIKLVQIWYDEIINNNILDTKKILKKKRTRHCSDSKAQCCLHPDLPQEKKTRHHSDSKAAISEPKKSIKDKYMGLTMEMHCGLKATIIDYKDCNNLTIQFEDGLIKSNVRSDHFMNGHVRHTPNSIES